MDRYENTAPGCYIRYYLTGIDINLNWPQNVYLVLKLQAEQSVLDFIIYISSVIGLWFGFTMVDMLLGVRYVSTLIERKFGRQYDNERLIIDERPSDSMSAFYNRHRRSHISFKYHHKMPKLSAVLNYGADEKTLRAVDAKLSRFEERVMRNVQYLISSNQMQFTINDAMIIANDAN